MLCTDWEKGLNNTSIDNDFHKYECQILTPKYCPYKIGKYFLYKSKENNIDFTKKDKNSREKFIKSSKSLFINNKTSHFGFPLTNKEEKYFYDMNFNNFRYIW